MNNGCEYWVPSAQSPLTARIIAPAREQGSAVRIFGKTWIDEGKHSRQRRGDRGERRRNALVGRVLHFDAHARRTKAPFNRNGRSYPYEARLLGVPLDFEIEDAVDQGGIAAALGALVAPLAAILPFVDAGLAEDANCSALLAGREEERREG